jgi:hypothetical protein
MVKQFFQQGRSKRRTEAYFFRYVEVLSAARTQLKDCFTIPLGGAGVLRQELINHFLELPFRSGTD